MAQLKTGSTAGGEIIATRDWVTSTVIGGAPAALDTLNELAAAIGDNASYAASITTALAGKLSTTGKAADSNLLDGIDSSAFLRSNANDTFTGALTIDGYIKGNGQQLVLNAGESHSYATGQTAEYIYLNAEQGLEINSETGNWNGGWAARKTAYLRGDQLTLDGETLTKPNIQNFKTAYGWGNHAGLYDSAGSADAVNQRIDTEVFDAIATVDGNIPTNNNQLTNGAGYITSADGGNAQTLDGINSTSFLRSDANDTKSGDTTFTGKVTLQTNLVITEDAPTISFLDTTSGADDFYIHVNSNNFYVLRDTAGANTVDGGWDTPHPMQLEGDTNRAYFFGNMLNTAAYQPSSAFETAGASAIVNDRIETEIIPSITTAQSAANDAQAAADLAVATADTAEARANSAREDAAAAATAAAAAQTTADGKLGATAKAADSDLLDGINSGSFLRSDADDNVSAHTEWQDNKNIRLGNGADFRMWHDGSHTIFRNYNHAAGNIYFQGEATDGNNHGLLYMITDTTRPYVKLYEDGGEKLRTKSTGVEVFGEVRVSSGIRSTSSGGYGIIRGYDNDNHFIVIRGAVTTGQSTLEITGAHKTTFVEHADDSNEGWYFVSKASGNYTEKARIDGLGNIYSSNIITNQANIQSITSDGTIANDKGSYLHLGGWAVSRTHASAVLVNTAYRADYADSFFDMNISRMTNNSGYITQGSVDALGEELRPEISTAQTTADEATSLARAAQTTADSKLGATAKAADSDKLDGYDWMQSGKNVRANEFYADNWFRNYNSGEGIYNQATAVHWYSDSTARWRHRSGSSSESWILMCTSNNAARGSFYATSNNEVGILDADNHWAVRVVHDSYVEFRDNNEVTFRVGQGGVSGNYGTVQTHGGGKGNWEGYSINGWWVFMSSDGSNSGIYNDVDNEWMTRWYRNGGTELMHNGSTKLTTTSTGVSVTGTVSATSFSGSGAGLTNLPIPDQRIPASVNGEPVGVVVSINFNLDRGNIEFTLDDGQTFNGAFGR